MRKWLAALVPLLWTNWLTLSGALLATVCGSTLLFVVSADIFSLVSNQYSLAFLLLVVPGLFVFALILIPLGLWRERHKVRSAEELGPIREAFAAAFSKPRSRRLMIFLILATPINIALVALISVRAVGYMDSVAFCGTVCHTVMEPVFDAHQRSPHSRVACVDCHIGPGASFAAKAKVDGLRQVWAVATDSFSRPIPTPVHQLRPARDTCEQCHWPAKFHGSKIEFYTHFVDDEQNTPEVNALILKTGGVDPRSGKYEGIHWHVSPEVEVRYEVLNANRTQIGDIVWAEGGKERGRALSKDPDAAVIEERVMDCVDCHNQPTHIYDGSASQALDNAFLAGRLDRSVPYLKKVALAIIEKTDRAHNGLESTYAAELKNAYTRDYPDVALTESQIKKTAETLAALYRRNIYPSMQIGWDTYFSHLGHEGEENTARGCFRCHDEDRKGTDGTSLSRDCDLCHEILHYEESLEDIPEELRGLVGLSP